MKGFLGYLRFRGVYKIIISSPGRWRCVFVPIFFQQCISSRWNTLINPEKSSTWAMKKTYSSCLGYVEDYTTHFNGDYSKPVYMDINQPGFVFVAWSHWMVWTANDTSSRSHRAVKEMRRSVLIWCFFCISWLEWVADSKLQDGHWILL